MKHLEKVKTQGKKVFSIDLIIECINDQPTAYDLDKVVRELEEYIPQEIEMSHERYLQYLALDKAIEIVKRGWKNE